MDIKLINKFRSVVCDSGCYTYYSNINGKNLWNCICSAMDWITVGVEDINFDISFSYIGHSSADSIAVMTLLMRIALIKEGIEQLHRVFFCPDNHKKIYLKDDCTVWNENPYHWTDNEYFENLRACFGAHPINLKGIHENFAHSFASWSYFDGSKCSILIYPSGVGEEIIMLHISLSKLEQYADLRYQHLNDMILLIQKNFIQS